LAEISFIDCTEVIKEYVFACQAIHISAEAKEKRANGDDLEEQKQLVEDEVELELVENELCHYKKLSCHTRRRRRD
jgi:hypothetical protein